MSIKSAVKKKGNKKGQQQKYLLINKSLEIRSGFSPACFLYSPDKIFHNFRVQLHDIYRRISMSYNWEMFGWVVISVAMT